MHERWTVGMKETVAIRMVLLLPPTTKGNRRANVTWTYETFAFNTSDPRKINITFTFMDERDARAKDQFAETAYKTTLLARLKGALVFPVANTVRLWRALPDDTDWKNGKWSLQRCVRSDHSRP